VRKRDDVQERNVALAAFDAPDVVAMEIGQFRKFLLRETSPQAQFAYMYSEHSSGVGGCHAAIIGVMTTMSLHTMSVID
jgi:hypothetical protein